MYHIEFQVRQIKKERKKGATENISVSGTMSTSFQSSRPNNEDHIHSPFTAALQPFSIFGRQNAVYFYLRSSLSSSEKAKWVVEDSFFTTSIPRIVLAAYSGVLVQGVKRGVTGRGPNTRAESCELSYGEKERRPGILIHYLFVFLCVYVSIILFAYSTLWAYTQVCIMANSGEWCARLSEAKKKPFNSCLSASAVTLQIISLLHSNQAVGFRGEK